jgi:outer membrane cobalamin receptor
LNKTLPVLFLLCALPAFCQTNTGELRLKVTDPSGAGVKSTVLVVSEANQYRASLSTNNQGELDVLRLPFGIYQVQVNQQGFQLASASIQIRSLIPVTYAIRLKLSSVKQSVTVKAGNTLINPDQAGSVNQIGHNTIEHRLTSIPGRSLQDLVNSQPGWLYEGNAVLHPRGSEYQTQFVVDGIPFTNNLSPSFGTEVGADDVQSMSIYTAGIPAEYGRSMGGVIVVNTLQNPQPGFHGQAVLSGGSYDTAGAFAQGEYGWGANSLGFSASGDMTDHYLNPVVTQNYSNTGTLGDFSGNFQRELTPKDRISLSVRHELARYDLPNENVQQQAGQRQNGGDFDTYGIAVYQHTFSSNAVASVRGMVRQFSDDFNSNPESTPIELFQHNWFTEGYVKADLTIDHGPQEWEAGAESDNKFLNENFRYNITDPTQYDPSTPLTFSFIGNRPDLEQAAYAQDLIRLGNWTINAGIRWDHYQLILNRTAFSPRLSISRYFPSAGTVLHFSYDRIFETPSFENLLLSSSTAAAGLDTISLQLPVQPSEGNYYEAGLEKVFDKKIRVDANYFRRDVNNYADDDQIDNTTISYPIAFQKAIIYGAEGKIELPLWGKFSGYGSYSYEVGNAWFPVTGGLFLGDDAIIPTSGHFPDSQDQRNTFRGRLRYQLSSRFWVAGGVEFDSGLPFDFQCPDGETLQQCGADEAAIYGEDVVDRVNLARGRIDPATMLDASAGADLYESKRLNMQVQVDGENLNNVVNVIDFGGLFSGNAIGPARSVYLRLTASF